MTTNPFEPGQLITNGSSAGEVMGYGRDAKWKTHGCWVRKVGLEEFNGNVGFSSFIPDYLLTSWRPLPLEWTRVVGGGLEERYVPTTAGRFRREVRRVEA